MLLCMSYIILFNFFVITDEIKNAFQIKNILKTTIIWILIYSQISIPTINILLKICLDRFILVTKLPNLFSPELYFGFLWFQYCFQSIKT